MSMSRSSWCCCSWCSPRVINSDRPGCRGRPGGLPLRRRHGRYRAISSMPGREGGRARAGGGGHHSLVVRVEDVGVGIVEGVVAGGVLPEDEGLEEPGHVGPVPLRRADVGHRLDRLVLGAQDRGQPLGRRPNPGIGARRSDGASRPVVSIRSVPSPPPGAVAHAGCTVPVTLPRHPRNQARLSHIPVAARWLPSGSTRPRAAEAPCRAHGLHGMAYCRGMVGGRLSRGEIDGYLGAVDWLRGILGRAEVAGVWNEPSVVARYTVGGMAAHAVHGVVWLEQLLTDAEPVGLRPVGVAEFFGLNRVDETVAEAGEGRVLRFLVCGRRRVHRADRGRAPWHSALTTSRDQLVGLLDAARTKHVRWPSSASEVRRSVFERVSADEGARARGARRRPGLQRSRPGGARTASGGH